MAFEQIAIRQMNGKTKLKIKSVVNRLISQLREEKQGLKTNLRCTFAPKRAVVTSKVAPKLGDTLFEACEIAVSDHDEISIDTKIFDNFRRQGLNMSMSKLDSNNPKKMDVSITDNSDYGEIMTDFTTSPNNSSISRSPVDSFSRLLLEYTDHTDFEPEMLKSCVKRKNSELDSKTSKSVTFKIMNENGSYDIILPKSDTSGTLIDSEYDLEDELAYYAI